MTCDNKLYKITVDKNNRGDTIWIVPPFNAVEIREDYNQILAVDKHGNKKEYSSITGGYGYWNGCRNIINIGDYIFRFANADKHKRQVLEVTDIQDNILLVKIHTEPFNDFFLRGFERLNDRTEGNFQSSFKPI